MKYALFVIDSLEPLAGQPLAGYATDTVGSVPLEDCYGLLPALGATAVACWEDNSPKHIVYCSREVVICRLTKTA